MNECTYKNYDELPLMLNVVQVAAVLGCSPDQLFFTSLRILHFQSYYFNAGITRSYFGHQFNSVRFIILDTNKCLIHLYSLHQDRNTYHDFFSMFQH